MSNVLRRATEPARSPARRVITHYRDFFEELIHTVKSELVDRFDHVDERLEAIELLAQSVADRQTSQAAALRGVQAELEHLQDMLRELNPPDDGLPPPVSVPTPPV